RLPFEPSAASIWQSRSVSRQYRPASRQGAIPCRSGAADERQIKILLRINRIALPRIEGNLVEVSVDWPERSCTG
ncbi:hypothetical protein, partial [Acidisphaera sp. S103]|uniref:hypothetical protein n=1 Tax=Acidisphaera sp. S103 TaxID=1747223 RepID=UPI001C204959